MYFLYIILVGLVAGWAAGKIMKGSGYGPLMDIVLGAFIPAAVSSPASW